MPHLKVRLGGRFANDEALCPDSQDKTSKKKAEDKKARQTLRSERCYLQLQTHVHVCRKALHIQVMTSETNSVASNIPIP